jgi:membrane protein
MSLTRVRLREAWNWGGLSARELAIRTYEAMDRHDTLDRAAVVAYYGMLALVPLLGLVLALSVGARGDVGAEIERLTADFLPPEAHKLVSDQIQKIQHSTPVGLLSLSLLLLLWSASSLFVAVMDATNASYGVRDGRPWWKRRLMAIVLTLCEAILLIGASASIILWPYLTGWLHLGGLAEVAATVVQWVVVVVALLAAFALAYYFGPHVEQSWEWITPGATLGVLALVAMSLGFRLYLHFFSTYSATYSALAGVVLMLLWLYLAALALLVGAEINSVIEHAAPHGKEPGQKGLPESAGAAKEQRPARSAGEPARSS